MRKKFMGVGAILIGCVWALPAHAESTTAVRKELQALYDQSGAAIGRKDIIAATAIDTADYITVDDTGNTHTLAETQLRAAQIVRKPQIVKMTMHVDKVTFQGSNAIAETSQHMYLKYTNAKTHHVFITDQHATTTDIWKKQGMTWRRAHGQTRSIQVILNGKLVYSSTAKSKPSAR